MGVGGGRQSERMPREGNAGEEEGEPMRREREYKSRARPDTLEAASCFLCSARGFRLIAHRLDVNNTGFF